MNVLSCIDCDNSYLISDNGDVRYMRTKGGVKFLLLAEGIQQATKLCGYGETPVKVGGVSNRNVTAEDELVRHIRGAMHQGAVGVCYFTIDGRKQLLGFGR